MITQRMPKVKRLSEPTLKAANPAKEPAVAGGSGLLGDDPIASKEIMDKEAAKKEQERQAAEEKKLNEILEKQMNKYGGALNNTLKEIMDSGSQTVIKAEDTEEVK